MKTKSLFMGLFLTLVMFALVSCEKDKPLNTNPNASFNRDLMDSELMTHIGDFVNMSNFLKNSKSFVADEEMVACDIDTLELWYSQDFPFGIVTITDDDENLIVKYELYPELILAGWSFHTTYLFVGDYANLPYTVNTLGNTVLDWHATGMVAYTSNPTVVIRKISLETLDECFGIATKVKLNNPTGGQNPNPRAILLNDGLRGAYTWAEYYEYCICDNPCESPGTGTQGYWHKVLHWEDWGISEITIGGITYTAAEATELIKKAGANDKTYDMFAQLVAAKLNVLIGNCDWCIADDIDLADAWMVLYSLGSGVLADGDAWKFDGEVLKDLLDEYNNGESDCALPRD